MSMACPKPIAISGDDNVEFKAHKKGDENLNWIEDTSGNPIVRDEKDNKLYYAEFKNNKFEKREGFNKESRKKHLNGDLNFRKKRKERKEKNENNSENNTVSEELANKSTESIVVPKTSYYDYANFLNFPNHINENDSSFDYNILVNSNGSDYSNPIIPLNLLVIHAKFTNPLSKTSLSNSAIENLIVGKNTFGTLENYYSKTSKNAIGVNLVGIVDVTLNNSGWSSNNYSGGLVLETAVLNAVKNNSAFDFSPYETLNEDGVTLEIKRQDLSILIIAHLYEGAITNTTDIRQVWAHAYIDRGKNYSGTLNWKTNNNAQLRHIAIVGEIHGTNYLTMGTIAHELGHSRFSLPDLYGIHDDDGSGIGIHSLMGSGNWGMNIYDTTTPTAAKYGTCPAYLDPFSLDLISSDFVRNVTDKGKYKLDYIFGDKIVSLENENWIYYIRRYIIDRNVPNHYDNGIIERLGISDIKVNAVLVFKFNKDLYNDFNRYYIYDPFMKHFLKIISAGDTIGDDDFDEDVDFTANAYFGITNFCLSPRSLPYPFFSKKTVVGNIAYYTRTLSSLKILFYRNTKDYDYKFEYLKPEYLNYGSENNFYLTLS
jgi:M6 family metalloprotease-like protein